MVDKQWRIVIVCLGYLNNKLDTNVTADEHIEKQISDQDKNNEAVMTVNDLD